MRLNNVSPLVAPNYIPDLYLANAKGNSEATLRYRPRSVLPANIANLFAGQLGVPVVLSAWYEAVRHRVQRVLSIWDVFQVSSVIVRLVAIYVIDTKAFWARGKEGFCNQLVHQVRCNEAMLAKDKMQVATGRRVQLANQPHPRAAARTAAAHLPETRYFIPALIANDRSPLLYFHSKVAPFSTNYNMDGT